MVRLKGIYTTNSTTWIRQTEANTDLQSEKEKDEKLHISKTQQLDAEEDENCVWYSLRDTNRTAI